MIQRRHCLCQYASISNGKSGGDADSQRLRSRLLLSSRTGFRCVTVVRLMRLICPLMRGGRCDALTGRRETLLVRVPHIQPLHLSLINTQLTSFHLLLLCITFHSATHFYSLCLPPTPTQFPLSYTHTYTHRHTLSLSLSRTHLHAITQSNNSAL